MRYIKVLDKEATTRFCNIFYDMEPFTQEPFFDDELNPTSMYIPLDDGFDVPGGFEVRWKHQTTNTEPNDYHIHYKEPFESDNPDIEYRFGSHKNPHSPQKHFHEPPDASSIVPSCITVGQVPLVTRAVAKTWRYAYENDNFNLVNNLSNPP